MAVVFKSIKYKHVRQAQTIAASIQENAASPDELIQFVMSLVGEWDFRDIDNGQPLALGDYEELTIDQFNELMAAFNAQMTASSDGVKKTKGGPSSSMSTQSRRAKSNSHAHPTG